MVSFELMTKIQFENFMKQSLSSYISETAIALRVSEECASARAQDQITGMLNEGQNTPNNFFYAIVSEETGVQVGYIWLTLREQLGQRSLFISDVQIEEPYRGKTIGTTALTWVDQKARELNCDTVTLHVFGHNEGAFKLYQKLGFTPFSIHMRKVL